MDVWKARRVEGKGKGMGRRAGMQRAVGDGGVLVCVVMEERGEVVM